MAYNDDVFESYLTVPEEQRDGIGERLCKMEAKSELQAALKLLAVSRQADVAEFELAGHLEAAALKAVRRWDTSD